MTQTPLKEYRERQAKKQAGRCFYCSFPMWSDDREAFSNKYGISRAEALRFRCTAEHLRARCDGGKTCASNIAACLFCNSHRHRRKEALAWEPFRIFVERRLKRGAWHPRPLHKVRAGA